MLKSFPGWRPDTELNECPSEAMKTSGPVLLAEDNPDDVLLVRLGFKKAGCTCPIFVVTDGEQAVRYLKGEGDYADRDKFPVPVLVLLDLKLPRLNGFDVLSWIRKRLEWKCLPVIILTTSHYGKDIEQAYDLGANSFLTKPSDIDEWMNAIQQTIRFWLQDSSLPEAGPFIPEPKEAKEPGLIHPPGFDPRRSRRVKVPRKKRDVSAE